jgi:hypothetical protein
MGLDGKPLNSDVAGRDWLMVASGTGDDDIGILRDFLDGRPLADSEVRNAIVRILHGDDTLRVGRSLVSMLFGYRRDWEPVWVADFKRTDNGKTNPWRDKCVAAGIQIRRDSGMSYDEAVAEVAEILDRDNRRVKQIYGEQKDRITKLHVRSMKPES